MPDKNDHTETVEIRLQVTGRPDEMKVLAAKWLRSNKTEVLDFLARGMKPEIIADNDATPSQIHGAKVESAAFFRYMAEALGAQIAIDRGQLPTVADAPLISQVPAEVVKVSSPLPIPAPPPSAKVENPDDDDDWDDDDFPEPPKKSTKPMSAREKEIEEMLSKL
jgi:hypothetical protein